MGHVGTRNGERDRAASDDPREADTVAELLRRAARAYGDKTALQVSRDGQWTRLSYRELFNLASAWADVLAGTGLGSGDCALLAAGSCPEWGAAYFAAALLGATVVPLDPQLSASDIAVIAERIDARVWLLSRDVAERVGEEPARSARTPTILQIEQFSAPPDTSLAAAQLPQTPAEEPAAAPAGQRDDRASILFTSGTTVAPKGVPLTHGNFLSNVRAVLEVIDVDESDEFLAVLPLHHALAFTTTLLLPLSIGATVTYLDRLTPKALIEAMAATQTTLLIAVPRLYALLAKGIRANIDALPARRRAALSLLLAAARVARGLTCPIPALGSPVRRLRSVLFRPVHRRFGGRLRLLVSGGAALPPEIYDMLDLMGFCVCEGYGLTETSPVLTINPPRRPRCGTVGLPLPGIEVRIESPGADGVGEVLVRGASVFEGYLEDEGATRRAFSDEWFRTGDHGRLDRDGHLILSGRADDMIVTGGGKNVYPNEVEWLYRELPHVKEMCVLGMPDPGSAGEAVHAVVVLEDSEDGPPADARRRELESALSHISRGLPTHQRIRGIHFWEGDLPRTSTLKVKRRAVRQALL